MRYQYLFQESIFLNRQLLFEMSRQGQFVNGDCLCFRCLSLAADAVQVL